MIAALGPRLTALGRRLTMALLATIAAAQQPTAARPLRSATAAELPVQIGVTVQP